MRGEVIDTHQARKSVLRRHCVTPLRRDLRAIVGDGAAFSVMVGIGETYLPAFILALGMGEVTAGLIATVPLLGGAVLQLISPSAVRSLGSYRKWVVLCATLQAAMFIPLVLAASVGSIPTLTVFAVAAVYWGAGLATGPSWNTWVGTLVPQRVRARFFGHRTRISQIGALVGFLVGGVTLHVSAERGHLLSAFAAVFFVAGLCRLISARFLARQSEPASLSTREQPVFPWDFFVQARQGGHGRLFAYMAMVQLTVHVAAPFFTPFMLRELRFSYGQYVSLIATSFVAKAICLPALGGLAQKYGARWLLWVGGVGIVPLAGLWVISNAYAYLLGVQLFGGVVWAAYELATFLLFFETIPPEQRTGTLTVFNLVNAVAMVGGSFVGAGIMMALGQGVSAYITVFGVSTLGRAAALAILPGMPKVHVQLVSLARRTVALRPSSGSMDRPILPSIVNTFTDEDRD